jgi:hypothetical protein
MGFLRAILKAHPAQLAVRLQQFFKITSGREPGFIGPIPFLLLLRYLILIAILLRFSSHRKDYTAGMLWLIGITVLAFALTSALVTFVTTLPSLRTSKPTQYAIIVADIILLTLLYIYTGNPQSDFFLFYYLPALTSAEYLPTREMLLSFLGVTVAFSLVLVLQHASVQHEVPHGRELLSRVFLPREVFFLSVVLASCFLLILERRQRERAVRSEGDLIDLLTFKTRVDRLFSIGDILELTSQQACTSLGADRRSWASSWMLE